MSSEPDYLLGSLVGGVLLALLALAASVWRVGPDERLVVRRSGRVRAVTGPGLRFILPGLDRATRVPVRPLQAELWCRGATRAGAPVLIRGRATFRVSDPDRYATAPDLALDLACRAAEDVLRRSAASPAPAGGRALAAEVPETAGLTATDLEPLASAIPLQGRPSRHAIPEEGLWS
ncbi:SPFH domain-containing protein [Actinocorallia populi]|uniref:SPFH domain-containing protein n=1 Tax=Actinocorallia populi TaxID=2079200 RepID=UPI000D08DFB3|nr:SPFH domain-containing protein [Actinocorallia populi]